MIDKFISIFGTAANENFEILLLKKTHSLALTLHWNHNINMVIIITACSTPELINPCQADTYMQKTCDVAEKAILAKKKLRKNCVNRDKF